MRLISEFELIDELSLEPLTDRSDNGFSLCDLVGLLWGNSESLFSTIVSVLQDIYRTCGYTHLS